MRKVSPGLPAFTGSFEGFVSKAYLDPGGVLTIGHGFTNMSRIFSSYWKEKHGRKLQMGDVITKAESLKLLEKLLNEEYGPPVHRVMPDVAQNVFDAATDMCYNCGPGSLKWKWAQAFSLGNIEEGADRLRKTATTAGGRILAGLVRRRAAEADMALSGRSVPNYQVVTSTKLIKAQTDLKSLGFYSGEVDGTMGPLTEGAIKNFQKENGLKVDGILGPATLSTINRKLVDRTFTRATPLAAGLGGTGQVAHSATNPETLKVDPSSFSFDGYELLIAAVISAAVVALAWFLYRNRGRILRHRTPTS